MEKTRLRWLWTLVLVLLFCGAGREVRGQGRIYVIDYASVTSNTPLLTSSSITAPSNVVGGEPVVPNYSEMKVTGLLLGNAEAHLQLKLSGSSDNLPGGTPVFLQVDGNTDNGLLGLILTSNNLVSVQKNINPSLKTQITGTSVSFIIERVNLNGSLYLKITPNDCFGAVTISLTTSGLLNLLSTATLKIYHAYIELPTISVDSEAICYNESMELAVNNPISSSGCNYRWYTQPTGGTLLGTGASFLTPKLTHNVTYYVGYSGADPAQISRKAVNVTVKPRSPVPNIELHPNSEY